MKNKEVEITFRGKTHKIKLKVNVEHHTKTEYSRAYTNREIVYPCGDARTFYPSRKGFDDFWENAANQHFKKCKACLIILGLSKRKTGLTQREIAQLFEKGLDGYETTNFKSVDGILRHYWTIEAVRTFDNKIINNYQCFNRGFAHCSPPHNVDASLPLNPIREPRSIKILEKTSNGILFTTQGDKELIYWLHSRDDRQNFVVELIKPCKTVKEAFDSMKPEIIQRTTHSVKRQGDLFFIEVSEGLRKAQPKTIEKRTKTLLKRAYYECSKCGIKTKPFITEETRNNTIERNNNAIDWNKSHPYVRWSINATQKQKDCSGNSGDMKLVEYDSFQYSPFPQIAIDDKPTRHTVTTKATLGLQTVVKGCVRHPEHTTVKLGDTWHLPVKNLIKQSLDLGRGMD